MEHDFTAGGRLPAAAVKPICADGRCCSIIYHSPRYACV